MRSMDNKSPSQELQNAARSDLVIGAGIGSYVIKEAFEILSKASRARAASTT